MTYTYKAYISQEKATRIYSEADLYGVGDRLDREARAICGTDNIDHSELTEAQYEAAVNQYENVLGKLSERERRKTTETGTYFYKEEAPQGIAWSNLVQTEIKEVGWITTAVSARDQLIWKNRNHAAQLRENIARRRALRLLLAHLTADQAQEWERERAFHVETADGRRRYRIRLGTTGNIELVKCEGPVQGKRGEAIKEGSRFCWHVSHPEGRIPDEDNVLAQKLMLESLEGERQFLAQANVS